MKLNFSRFVFVAALFAANCVRAFLPPSDARGGVELRIEGFVEMSTAEQVVVEKVSTAAPLEFVVTLVNGRAERVEGELGVWLNDDWSVEGGGARMVSAEAGGSVSFAFSARAGAGVLEALYPVHARFAFDVDGEIAELHPVAIFEAVKPVEEAGDGGMGTPGVAVVSAGTLRLDADAEYMAYYSHEGVVFEMGANFNMGDPASGAFVGREGTVRGGVARGGFAMHPPWRGGGGGAVWCDFMLALPEAGEGPVELLFHTAIRDSSPDEGESDGGEFKVFVVDEGGAVAEIFSRFSGSKVWEGARVDLGAYAGRRVTLRLWTGPGPNNDTTCDQCYWGDPVVRAGELPAPPSDAEWGERGREAVAGARRALAAGAGGEGGESDADEGAGDEGAAFFLDVRGESFGAAVALGAQGLVDGVIAFSDGARELAFRGFVVEINGAVVGGENGPPVMGVEVERVEVDESGGGGAAWVFVHRVAMPGGAVVPARARVSVVGGALRVAWDMPGVVRDARGEPRFTRLGIGAGDAGQAVWRAYAGFGNVIESPGDFTLAGSGFELSTRHVGADYTNGLSLAQACDIFPDRLAHSSGASSGASSGDASGASPELRRFALETHHDAAFLFVPSARGAFAAARAYRDVCGFERSPGLDALGSRMCLDQWDGDYLEAAAGLREAARYGVTNAVFVKHVWQRWGYDYRLPEIHPPQGGLEPFLAMRDAAKDAGILFAPHDNYIDFYPDAEGFSYDHIVFGEDGRPERAWHNAYRAAQSYRWLPHAFRPRLEDNMRLMRGSFAPDSLFIDVFTAIAPFDYRDRAGAFHPKTRAQQEWRAAFDESRRILGDGAVMISEAGADALAGSLDAAQSDHFHASRWLPAGRFADSERVPWHDMATHGAMALFAGGLGNRYSSDGWDDAPAALQAAHGYGSDDYLSNTVIGGRNPMSDGPFSRRAVMTSWLLQDVCDALARADFEAHEFGPTIHQQHATFSDGGEVWTNRGSNETWRAAGSQAALPEHGFHARVPGAQAGIVLLDGQRAAFAQTRTTYFADARPPHDQHNNTALEASALRGAYLGAGVFEVAFDWRVRDPAALDGYLPFFHICDDTAREIRFHAGMDTVPGAHTPPGAFASTARIAFPADQPAGRYRIRYGFYHPDTGARLPIRGLNDEQRRIQGGVLTIAKTADGAAFTTGHYELEHPSPEELQGLNTDGKMLNFGPLATDGAFRLEHGSPREWTLTPLPGSRPFRAELDLSALGAKTAKVKTIDPIDPFHAAAGPPDWQQTAAKLTLTCDAQSFSYRITFEEPATVITIAENAVPPDANELPSPTPPPRLTQAANSEQAGMR